MGHGIDAPSRWLEHDRQLSDHAPKGPSSGLSATFSHGPSATGEGVNLNQFCLLPFEEWEKVADRPDEGPFAKGIN